MSLVEKLIFLEIGNIMTCGREYYLPCSFQLYLFLALTMTWVLVREEILSEFTLLYVNYRDFWLIRLLLLLFGVLLLLCYSWHVYIEDARLLSITPSMFRTWSSPCLALYLDPSRLIDIVLLGLGLSTIATTSLSRSFWRTLYILMKR